MHARRRDRDDGHVPLLQGGDLDYRPDLRKSRNVPYWSFFPGSVRVYRVDWIADTVHDTRLLAPYERWHWRENRRSPYESEVPQSAIKLRVR